MECAWALVLWRRPPLLMVLWACLSSVYSSRGPLGWRFTSSEIVIPRKVHHKVSGADRRDQLSYSIRFQGRRHVIHMKVKRTLLPRHFLVVTNNDQGAMQEDHPYVPRDCYYFSYLEGVPGSMATLDTCNGGLRGMLQVDDLTYEIKPLEASSTFEHVVSNLVLEEASQRVERCTIEEEGMKQALEEQELVETPRAGPVYLWVGHRRYLGFHISVTKNLYEKNDENSTRVVESIMIMNSIIDTIYGTMHLCSYVQILCIWTDRDANYYSYGGASDVVEQYGLWKDTSISKVIGDHSMSLLLTGEPIGGITYFCFPNSLCNPNWGAGYVYIRDKHLFLSACIAAHAVAHGVGVSHDTSGCYCFRRTHCVMAPLPGLLDTMSNCSYVAFHHRFTHWDTCLSDRRPSYNNMPYVAPRCGDKIVNQREECDCGSLKECAQDKCCGTNCAMTLGSLCDGGSCCHKCKYLPPGSVCRDILGICDLPEYCDGHTPECPPDAYVQDGTPCSVKAVCMAGNCSDRDMQCQALFGYQTKDGSPLCYSKLNKVGDRVGNCGVQVTKGGGKPVKCEADDVFCGMLHCQGITEIFGGGEHSTFRQIIVKDIKEETCFGYDAHFGTEKPYMGLVVDGASCGPGRFCHNQTCTYFQDLNFTCNVSTCNYRGVCNNKRNCHCLRGWKPPTCLDKGGGGSIDSGPPPDKDPALQVKIFVKVNQWLVIMFSRAVLLLLSIFMGALSQIKRLIEKKRLKQKATAEKQGNPASL